MAPFKSIVKTNSPNRFASVSSAGDDAAFRFAISTAVVAADSGVGVSDRDMLRFALRRFRRLVRADCFEPEITASVERTESNPHFLSRGG